LSCCEWMETDVKLYGAGSKALSYLIEFNSYPRVEVKYEINISYRTRRIADEVKVLEVLLTHPSWGERCIVISEYEDVADTSSQIPNTSYRFPAPRSSLIKRLLL